MKKILEKILNISHSELVSGSPASLVKNKMLNIVRLTKSLLVKCFSMTSSNELSLVKILCHSEFISESPASLVGQQDSEYRKTILNAFIERLRMAKTTHSLFAKAIAFTLAETLVVMGIIGVVAALTIPNLNQSTGDREKVAKLKKVYANLTDSFGRATAVYGPIDEWFINEVNNLEWHDRLAGRMTEFMKISKSCGNSGEGCFPTEEYKTLDGDTEDTPYGWDEPKFLLADGTALDFYVSSKDCSFSQGQLNDVCGTIYVDIDGVKGSNTNGKDYFTFYVAKSGIYPMGIQLSDTTGGFLNTCFETGYSCAAWVIETGNMDYLKADRDGKCPNGTQLSWDNTSCK